MDKNTKELDLVIIGAGPAGLTSAIYSSRANLKTLVLESQIIGGQVRSSYSIENYPGFKKITGDELSDRMQEQAVELGAEIDEFDLIEKVTLKDNEKIIETESNLYKPKAVIIATGAVPKKLPVPSEQKYSGKGIHYCAACDGAAYKDETIAVIGGGNSALEEALFLSKLAKKVIIIRRYDYFRGEATTLKEVEKTSNIEIMYNWDLVDLAGQEFVDKALIKNIKTNEEKYIDLKAVFVYIGTEPKTDLFKDYIDLTKEGYVLTDEIMRTNIKGVFAAGDVRKKEYRQITTAVADGTIAALQAEKYIQLKMEE